MLNKNDVTVIESIFDKKLEPIKKDINQIKKDLKKIKKDTNYMVGVLDREILKDRKRIEKLEQESKLHQSFS